MHCSTPHVLVHVHALKHLLLIHVLVMAVVPVSIIEMALQVADLNQQPKNTVCTASAVLVHAFEKAPSVDSRPVNVLPVGAAASVSGGYASEIRQCALCTEWTPMLQYWPEKSNLVKRIVWGSSLRACVVCLLHVCTCT
eukprot:scpid110448/ scgid20272/ 